MVVLLCSNATFPINRRTPSPISLPPSIKSEFRILICSLFWAKSMVVLYARHKMQVNPAIINRLIILSIYLLFNPSILQKLTIYKRIVDMDIGFLFTFFEPFFKLLLLFFHHGNFYNHLIIIF